MAQARSTAKKKTAATSSRAKSKAAPATAAKKPASKAAAKPKKPAGKAAAKAPARKSAPAKPVAAKVSSTGLTEAKLRRMSEAQYMNDQQLAYFRERLLDMRREVVDREVDVKQRLHQREVFADPADRATAEEEHWLDLRLRERESLLLKKIDESLRRIEDKEYGYCEVTGEPIGIPRLLARPTATVCVDVKGENEHIEAQYRDR